MVTPWCVKITCLPQGSSNEELANKFGAELNTIDIPQHQKGPNYYAWINGFSSEQHANEFVKKWSNQRIRSGTIKCKAVPTKSHMMVTQSSSLPRNINERSRSASIQKRCSNDIYKSNTGSQCKL